MLHLRLFVCQQQNPFLHQKVPSLRGVPRSYAPLPVFACPPTPSFGLVSLQQFSKHFSVFERAGSSLCTVKTKNLKIVFFHCRVHTNPACVLQSTISSSSKGKEKTLSHLAANRKLRRTMRTDYSEAEMRQDNTKCTSPVLFKRGWGGGGRRSQQGGQEPCQWKKPVTAKLN